MIQKDAIKSDCICVRVGEDSFFLFVFFRLNECGKVWQQKAEQSRNRADGKVREGLGGRGWGEVGVACILFSLSDPDRGRQ